ncbi:MAG: hypothetical protein R2861_16305 [Desulfobacterales bacterium]
MPATFDLNLTRCPRTGFDDDALRGKRACGPLLSAGLCVGKTARATSPISKDNAQRLGC